MSVNICINITPDGLTIETPESIPLDILLDEWKEEPEIEEEEPTRFQIENAGAWWENQIPANIEEVRRLDRFLKALRDKQSD